MYANDQFKPLSKRSLLTIKFNCYQKLGVGATDMERGHRVYTSNQTDCRFFMMQLNIVFNAFVNNNK